MLNKVQKAAFDLIQSDARFIYTLVDMQNNAKNINSNTSNKYGARSYSIKNQKMNYECGEGESL